MRSKPNNNLMADSRSGFTLVELLVGIFVVSISVLAVYQMFISGTGMLTEEYHRRLALENAQSKMELAESYKVAVDSIPQTLAGTFYEPLFPTGEGNNESAIQAEYTMTITNSSELDRDTHKPIYQFVTLDYKWRERADQETDPQRIITLKAYF